MRESSGSNPSLLSIPFRTNSFSPRQSAGPNFTAPRNRDRRRHRYQILRLVKAESCCRRLPSFHSGISRGIRSKNSDPTGHYRIWRVDWLFHSSIDPAQPAAAVLHCSLSRMPANFEVVGLMLTAPIRCGDL